MVWFKVDDEEHSHPKHVAAGNAAVGLWTRCGSWSGKYLTGGFVPKSIAESYGTAAQIKALLRENLWLSVDGGYQFHDWEGWQPAGEEVEELRRKRSAAGKKGAAKRWNRGKDDGSANGKPMASAIANTMANRCPDPDPAVVVEQVSSPPLADANQTTILEAIKDELHCDDSHARRVAHDVLNGRTDVKRPALYVLEAIRREPHRFKVPNSPDRVTACQHGRKFACAQCREMQESA